MLEALLNFLVSQSHTVHELATPLKRNISVESWAYFSLLSYFGLLLHYVLGALVSLNSNFCLLAT